MYWTNPILKNSTKGEWLIEKWKKKSSIIPTTKMPIIKHILVSNNSLCSQKYVCAKIIYASTHLWPFHNFCTALSPSLFTMDTIVIEQDSKVKLMKSFKRELHNQIIILLSPCFQKNIYYDDQSENVQNPRQHIYIGPVHQVLYCIFAD